MKAPIIQGICLSLRGIGFSGIILAVCGSQQPCEAAPPEAPAAAADAAGDGIPGIGSVFIGAFRV